MTRVVRGCLLLAFVARGAPRLNLGRDSQTPNPQRTVDSASNYAALIVPDLTAEVPIVGTRSSLLPDLPCGREPVHRYRVIAVLGAREAVERAFANVFRPGAAATFVVRRAIFARRRCGSSVSV